MSYCTFPAGQKEIRSFDGWGWGKIRQARQSRSNVRTQLTTGDTTGEEGDEGGGRWRKRATTPGENHSMKW
jgi:hypothetical protein